MGGNTRKPALANAPITHPTETVKKMYARESEARKDRTTSPMNMPEKTLLSSCHLMLIKAGDPCQFTYLRNLEKKTLPVINQMIKLVINKLTGHNQFHSCHPCGNTQKVKLLKSSGWARG